MLGDKIKRLELRIASFKNDSDVLKWRVGNLEAKIASLKKEIDQAVLDNQSRIEFLETDNPGTWSSFIIAHC